MHYKIKFGSLLKKAEGLECGFIATGHYARIERNGFCGLREAVDKAKDQSYVLFCLKSSQLKKTLLPIGGLKKDKVRDKAKEYGIAVRCRYWLSGTGLTCALSTANAACPSPSTERMSLLRLWIL